MKGLCSTGTMTGFDPSNNHLLEGKDLLPLRLKRMAHKPCAAGSWTWGCCFFGAPPGIATIYLLFGFHFPQESSAHQSPWPELGCEVAPDSDLSRAQEDLAAGKCWQKLPFLSAVLELILPTSDSSHFGLEIRQKFLIVLLTLIICTWLKTYDISTDCLNLKEKWIKIGSEVGSWSALWKIHRKTTSDLYSY